MDQNDRSMIVFRYSDRIRELKAQAEASWPELPPDALTFFGGELLASGVVLWALLNGTGLDAMRWPGDLPVVLGLKISGTSDREIGHALEMVAQNAGLVGAEVDELQKTFLEMLQWYVVDQLHASLFSEQRGKLAEILAHSRYTENERGAMLEKISEFLKSVNIYTYDAQGYFEKALKRSLSETLGTFSGLISIEKQEEIKKVIG